MRPGLPVAPTPKPDRNPDHLQKMSDRAAHQTPTWSDPSQCCSKKSTTRALSIAWRGGNRQSELQRWTQNRPGLRCWMSKTSLGPGSVQITLGDLPILRRCSWTLGGTTTPGSLRSKALPVRRKALPATVETNNGGGIAHWTVQEMSPTAVVVDRRPGAISECTLFRIVAGPAVAVAASHWI